MNLEDPRQTPKEIRKKTQKITLGLHHSKSFFFLFLSLLFSFLCFISHLPPDNLSCLIKEKKTQMAALYFYCKWPTLFPFFCLLSVLPFCSQFLLSLFFFAPLGANFPFSL